jgi:signal transduction histidine kinase
MARLFRKILPQNLAGQLIAVLLLALVVAQITSLAILHDDRRLAFIFVAQQEVMSRTASVVRLLAKTEPALHQTIVDAASSRRLRFQLTDKAAIGPEAETEGFDRFLQRRLAAELDGEIGEVRAAVFDDDDGDDNEGDEEGEAKNAEKRNSRNPFWTTNDQRRFREWRHHSRGEMRFSRKFRGRHHARPRLGMTISIATKGTGKGPGNGNGGNPQTSWLNVYSGVPQTSPAVAIPSIITIAIMAVLLVIIVILMVRRVTRPLAQLASNAERFGRGEDVGVLAEQGPADIRKATHAFNEMQERLTRFVQDRTRMLAAITHDLRTPITSLRIRAEMIEDEEMQEKILETLAEMQSLTEAALNFAREEALDEETRTVDLIALVDSLCQDLAALGQAVEFTNGDLERLPHACHPLALKRALRNVIENAVRYGDKAEVGVSLRDQEVCIRITDSGPGIAVEDQERIFEPFVRLEESRSRETGGIGLGLAIARTIIRSHGGDITVSADENGTVFSICLPQQH